MRILLLGSTGLLGRNVLNLLLKSNYDVVAFVRNSHGIRDIDNRKLSIIKGSLTDEESLYKASENCQAIINCAGTTDMSLLHYEDYVPINVNLCKTLAKIVETTDTKIIVHVSSANTIGYGTKERLGDEHYPMREPFASSYYAQSKREGEKYLEELATRHSECHLIILNPGFMIGAWDSKPSSGQLLLAGYKKPIMVIPKGGKSFVAVTDVARAVVSALTKGRNGERYLLTGEDLSLGDFYRRQSSVCNYNQLLITIPQWIVAAAGKIGDLLRLMHFRIQLSTINVRQLSVMEYYTNKKAEKELDFFVTPLDDAIHEFFEWQKNKKHKNKI